MDLPCEDVDAGLDTYADVVAAALGDAKGDVIVVAHSLNGLVAPHLAARRPVRSIAYLSGFVPVEGQSMGDQFSASPEPILTMTSRPVPDELGRSQWVDEAATTAAMYPDVSPEDAHRAFERLRRQAPKSQRERHPAGLPSVPAVSIVGRRDGLVNPAWSRRVAREQLGAEAIELDTGHFAMSTDPEALAEILAGLA